MQKPSGRKNKINIILNIKIREKQKYLVNCAKTERYNFLALTLFKKSNKPPLKLNKHEREYERQTPYLRLT